MAALANFVERRNRILNAVVLAASLVTLGRRGERVNEIRNTDASEIVVLPPVLVGGTLIVGVAIHYLVWTVPLLPPVRARLLGLFVFSSAGILARLSHKAMKRVGTNVFPTKRTLALATDGPYRF